MNNQDIVTVVIADDHEVFRSGTRDVLARIPRTEIVAEAEDGLSAITAVRKLKPDLLVLDAAMPLARGIEVYAEARRWSPDTKIVLLTAFTSAGILSSWLQAGVDGILLKSCSADELRQGLTVVLSGAPYLAEIVREIMNSASEPKELTVREREVLSLVLSGHANAEIAERLSISIKTVDKHRGSVMAKFGVHSIAELMVFAFREGLLDELKQL